MNIDRERLKPVRQRYLDSLDLRTVFNKRFMTREPEIYYVALILYRLLDIGLHEQLKLGQVRHTPNNIVSKPDVIECRIHLRNTAQDPVKCCHSTCLLYFSIKASIIIQAYFLGIGIMPFKNK